jgi:hypothetical protein
MKANRGFDEVMIVNPYDPRSNNQRHTKLMRFHQSPEFGYYSQPPEFGYYAEPAEIGYYGEPTQVYGGYGEPSEIGWYGEPPEMGYCAGPRGFGWYGEQPEFAYYGGTAPGYGYYGEPPEYGWYAAPLGFGYYAEQPEMGYYADNPQTTYGDASGFSEYEPVGYFAEEPPFGYYGQAPEMVGYADYEPLAEPYPEGIGYYGEPDVSGYVRDTATPPYNPGCPMPTNVAGFGEGDQVSGYTRPSTVNPICEQFRPQPGITESVPETFRPLW